VRTEFVILFVGFALFGSSIYVDELVKHSDWTYLLEDGFKFFGIVAWATYLLRVCSQFTDEWNVRIQ
jgi:cytochrome b561